MRTVKFFRVVSLRVDFLVIVVRIRQKMAKASKKLHFITLCVILNIERLGVMKKQSSEKLKEMLQGLRESLVVFEKVNDRRAIYEARGHIRRIEEELTNRAHEAGEDCGKEKCQECCPHSDERDHGMCIDCGHEEDPGAAIDRAMDYGQDR